MDADTGLPRQAVIDWVDVLVHCLGAVLITIVLGLLLTPNWGAFLSIAFWWGREWYQHRTPLPWRWKIGAQMEFYCPAVVSIIVAGNLSP